VVERVGLSAFVDQLRRLGLSGVSSPAAHYGLSLVLGTGEVRLLNLANAYAALARRGLYRPVRLLEDEPVAPGRALFTPSAAFLVADILASDDVAAAWVGHGADSALPRVALKTGTSNGLRDAWAFAYNPEYVVGVWLGNPDGSSSPALVGREVAAPLAYHLVRRLYPSGQAPWFKRPERVEQRTVCVLSGRRPGPGCTATETGWYIRGISRNPRCERCGAGTASAVARPEPGGVAPEGEGVRVVSPADGTTYRWLPILPGGDQRLVLRAEGEGGDVFWFVDDQLLRRSPVERPVAWPLVPGRHRIVCCDARGRSDAVTVLVE
jgi:penicillin-binding protein 1C